MEEEGTDWAIVESVSLVPFWLLHVSMVVFLLSRGRKDKSYRQAFYVFFVVVTIADCTVIVVVSKGWMLFKSYKRENLPSTEGCSERERGGGLPLDCGLPPDLPLVLISVMDCSVIIDVSEHCEKFSMWQTLSHAHEENGHLSADPKKNPKL